MYKLKDLRKQYPDIKSNSVEGFLKKLEFKKNITEPLLGDKVKDIIESVVPKKLLDMLGKDCGCKERQEALNSFDERFTKWWNNKPMLDMIAEETERVFGYKVQNRYSQCCGGKKHLARIKALRHYYKSEITRNEIHS